MPEHHDRRHTSLRIICAAITGATAGAIRALTGWLVDHMTSHG